MHSELDLERYHRIVCRMLRCSVPMAVFDTAGDLAWSSHPHDPAPAQRMSRAIRDALELGDGQLPEAYCPLPSTACTIVCRALNGVDGVPYGCICLLLEAGQAGASVSVSAALLSLAEVAPMLNRELDRIEELDAMALELGDRYDELSLLTEAEFSPVEPLECRDELSRQVRRCGDQLGVDLVMLWVKPLGMYFPAGTAYADDDEPANAWLRAAVKACFRWFIDGHGTVGVNEPQDASWAKLGIQPAYKLVAVPLHGGRQELSGVLVCANQLSHPDFSNSDRKVLEVVAESAAACVRNNQDELTGLRNRRGLKESLSRRVACPANGSAQMVLCLANLNQFKVINASYGPVAGDEVLKSIAALLLRHAKPRCTVARRA